MSLVPRSRRYSFLLPLRVWVRSWGEANSPAPAEATEEETITTNISSTGCYFLMAEEAPVGSAVDMEIVMQAEPGMKPLSKLVANGKIVRVEKEPLTGKTGVACEFGHLDLVPPSKKSKLYH